MSDLLFQNVSSVQSSEQPNPRTIVAEHYISPTTFITFLSGTGQVWNINPPVSGAHFLVFIWTHANPAGLQAGGGNVPSIGVNQYGPLMMFYDPIRKVYMGG